MANWWKSVALIAIGLAAGPAAAQVPHWPGAGSAPTMPEPMPCYDGPPVAMPGPVIGPVPEGAQSPVSLRGDLPNAWSDEKPYDPPTWYGSIGYMALQRQRLGSRPAALVDVTSNGIDTGNPPTQRAFQLSNFSDIDPRLMNGGQATIGYHWDRYALEASGFYLAQSSASRTVALPGSLNNYFNVNGDFTSFPLGFEGDNGMWLQDDIVRISLKESLASGEASFRWWLGDDSNFSWSIGPRFLQVYERFGYYVGDDDLTVLNVIGQPDPTRQATYTSTANNRIVAAQLGLEWNKPICSWMAFTLCAKGAWGLNFVEIDTLLQRGDGFVGFNQQHNNTVFSHLYEVGVFFDFALLERVRLRAGYDMLWALRVAEASSQVNFNLADQADHNTSGSIFYGGPVVEFHVIF
jgi:hypothetical protein